MAWPATFPTRYQDWTDAQKQAGLQMMTQRPAQAVLAVMEAGAVDEL